ncbi:cytochrome-c peroxidase [Bacillus sp. B-jedd]|uniref:cytochrome-c peroxidase n=1 Tax=Bacillus sp. B-jedd TaxID=1476857 RepID=UPI0005156014|nr:cytochrome c peroxidase [Bacillus sp. B-jedd]CEG26553.1 Cytochrome c551 peroxidase precursor [Bacillus sp. B-jedd]
MIRYLTGLLFLIFILLNMSGCSKEAVKTTEVPLPNPAKAVSQTETGEQTLEVTDELKFVLQTHQMLTPLGDIPVPDGNPMNPEVLKLGQALYFDPRLSGDNTRSCATCHDAGLGYGDGKATFEKVDGTEGARNSPTVINSGYYKTNFWDGRASSLEEQALGPIENPNEMNQDLDALIAELKAVEKYNEMFRNAFGSGITKDNIAKAIAAFERQIVVKDTAYDQFLQGDNNALNDQEVRGLALFTGKAMCVTCHNGPNLSDNNYYNIGIESDDEGRFAVTKEPGDLGRIRTPGLYGITHTAPYMRDGSLKTLEEVIDYYNRGGDDHPNKSFFMKQFMPLGLIDSEKADLLAFLKALGGEPPVFEKPELP